MNEVMQLLIDALRALVSDRTYGLEQARVKLDQAQELLDAAAVPQASTDA
jgi:hypothetical protein